MAEKPVYEELKKGIQEFAQLELESKHAEAVLWESEERYRSILESIEEAYFEVDLKGNFTFFNNSLSIILGYSREELMGKNNRDYMPQETSQEILNLFGQIYQTGKPVRKHAYEVIKKDGTHGFHELAASLMRDKDGKPIGFRGIAHDITERKRAEEALHKSEKDLKEAQHLAKIGSWDWDATTDTITWSEEYYHVYGFDPTQRPPEYVDHLKAYTPESAARLNAAVKRNMQTGEAYELDLEFARTEGPCRWITARCETKRDALRQIIGLRGTAQDITERKQAEEALRESNELISLFMKYSPIFVYLKEVTSTASIVMMASDNFKDMIGIPSSEMVGKTMEELFPAELAAKISADDWTVVSGGEMIKLDEDFNGRNYTTIKFPIPHRGKNLLAGYTIDITNLKQAELEKAELEAQNRQLQKAESLGRMAGAIAHHFNNQLQAVMGNLEMAMDGLPRGEYPMDALNEAMQAARNAAEVSRLMLTYLGQTPGKNELLDLSENCRLGLSMLRTLIPNKVIVESELLSPGPTIRANANQMQQVLANLVTNAWESISDNRGTIRLTVKTVSPAEIPVSHRFPIGWQPLNTPYACLEVTDTGCGIQDRDIEKIFDPFFTTKFTGRGLGLPVVQGIVGAHDGGVTVESEPGRGSVFRVFFPLSVEEVHRQPDKSIQSPEIQGGGTVLLIEDEDQVRKMAKKMLAHLGYSVLEAKDGAEAVEIFQQHQDEIHIVLSDLTMPRMNGWETLAALRKLSPDIPVILSSGYDEAQVMAGEHTEQPNAFLGKPYRLKELKDTICHTLADKKK